MDNPYNRRNTTIAKNEEQKKEGESAKIENPYLRFNTQGPRQRSKGKSFIDKGMSVIDAIEK